MPYVQRDSSGNIVVLSSVAQPGKIDEFLADDSPEAITFLLYPGMSYQNRLVLSVQKDMDDLARSYGYDNIFTAVTYADEPSVPKFQVEGQLFRALRSQRWAYCYQQMNAVAAGQRLPPKSEKDFIAEINIAVPFVPPISPTGTI